MKKTVSFTTPKPDQPYPSWVWENDQWNPPVAMPDYGKFYTWDEENKIWTEVSKDQ